MNEIVRVKVIRVITTGERCYAVSPIQMKISAAQQRIAQKPVFINFIYLRAVSRKRFNFHSTDTACATVNATLTSLLRACAIVDSHEIHTYDRRAEGIKGTTREKI